MTRRDDAVSNVVGAVLIFALLVSVLGMIQFSFVPVWEEDAEADHMRIVRQDFAALKSTLDRQADNDTRSALSSPLTMSADDKQFKFSLFARANLPASLAFVSGQNAMRLQATELAMLSDGSRTGVYALNEQWKPFASGTRIDDVDQMEHLRIRLIDPSAVGKNQPKSKTFFDRMTVIDADGAYAGQFSVYVEDHSSDILIRGEVKNQQGTVILDQTIESYKQTEAPPYFWINVLSEDTFFRPVLEAAKAPYDLVLTRNGQPADYATTFIREGVTQGGGGVVLSNYDQAFVGGRLTFASSNTRFMDQQYIFENGGVILVQPDGAAFAIPPEFTVRRSGNVVGITMKVPTLTGESQSVSSNSVLNVRTDALRGVTLEGLAPRFTTTVTTDHPQVWADFWRDRLVPSGLTEGTGYVITTTATTATLTVQGPDPAPGSTTYDINLRLRQSTIEVQLR